VNCSTARRRLADCSENYAKHVIKERVSRSYDFRKPSGSSHYAFALTWTPGTLSLTGDVGDMTLNQWHAMPTFEEAISWASTTDWSYLLSKSGAGQSYDADRTAAEIIEMADEHARDTIKGHAEECRDWYKRKPRGAEFYAQYPTARPRDLAEEFTGWLEDRPVLEFEASHRPFSWSFPSLTPPDGFELWEKLRAAFACWIDQADILTATGRTLVAREVRGFYADAVDHTAAEKSSELGLDDFYYATSWKHGDLAKIAAIQFGVAQIAAMLAAAGTTQAMETVS